MKKLIILVIVLCFFNKAFTQDYTPMLEIGKIWNMYLSFDYPDGYYFNIEDVETVEINGQTYHRIVASHNNCDTYLREDVNEKKVYGIWQGEEYLHYDFSLNIGDSMWIYGDFYEITAIEYGDFYGMTNLRYFVLDDSFNLIEGIGIEDYGIADAFEYGCLNNPIYETVQLINMNQPLAINDITKDEISIYPNPVENILTIKNSKFKINDAKVYSAVGNLVLSTQFQNKKNIIDVSNLSNGIYFVKLETDTGYLTKKVIKISN